MIRVILSVTVMSLLCSCGGKIDKGTNPILDPGPDGSPGLTEGFNFQTTRPVEVKVKASGLQTYSLLNKRNKKLSTFKTGEDGKRSLLLTVPSTLEGLYLELSDKSLVYGEIVNHNVEFNVSPSSNEKVSLLSELKNTGLALKSETNLTSQDTNVDYGAQYFPAAEGFATLIFEDLWPYLGDYDFNDLVVDYNIKENLDKEGLISGIQFQIKVVGTLASMNNGFGFQLGVSPFLVASVNGAKYTRGYTELEANGTESRQSKAVIIAFEDAKAHHNPEDVSLSELITINVEFKSGVQRSELGYPPYNPFLLSNGERGREIHMPGYSPTDLVHIPYLYTEDDTSNLVEGRSYIDSVGLPWAINLPETFFYPVDSKGVDETYNKFLEWVESEGVTFMDWYRDKPNYRKTEYIHRKRGTHGYVTCEDPFDLHTLLARYDSSVSTSLRDGLDRSAIHPNFNGNVNTWKDLSGNGYDITAVSDKHAPKVSIDSGVSQLQKDSHVLGLADDYLLVDIPDVTSDFTFILVATPSHENPDDYDSFFSNSLSPTENGSWQLGVRANESACPGSGGKPLFATYLNDNGKNVAICGGAYADTRNVLSVNYNSSTKLMTLSRNGNIEGTYTWTSTPTFRFLKMFINRAGSKYFDGQIHEVIMITSPLTLEENANIGHYLSCKWQVEL